uniref:Uncharacterized protein n=1 Tax=Molossus molossus TaxID=27622 RepID=A0A7J8CRV8_MOLMO|nr:hypothetical protein HJG59_009751 [Molossus molossus]
MDLHLLNSLHGFPDTSGQTLERSSWGGRSRGLLWEAWLLYRPVFNTPYSQMGGLRAKALLPLILAGMHCHPIARGRGLPAASLGSPGFSVLSTPAPGKRYRLRSASLSYSDVTDPLCRGQGVLLPVFCSWSRLRELP